MTTGFYSEAIDYWKSRALSAESEVQRLRGVYEAAKAACAKCTARTGDNGGCEAVGCDIEKALSEYEKSRSTGGGG